MILVFIMAGFLFLAMASLLLKFYQADKYDLTDCDSQDETQQSASVPVSSRTKNSNVVSLYERKK